MIRLVCASGVLAFALLLAACGDPTPEATPDVEATATAQPGETPSPGPQTAVATSTSAAAPATPDGAEATTPERDATPTLLTPEPASATRPDCERGDSVINDALFSLCYAADEWTVELSPGTAPGYERSYNIRHRVLKTYLGISIVRLSPDAGSLVTDLPKWCSDLSASLQMDVHEETLETADGGFAACVGSGEQGQGGFDPIQGYRPIEGDVFMQINAEHGAGDQDTIAAPRALLRTLLQP